MKRSWRRKSAVVGICLLVGFLVLFVVAVFKPGWFSRLELLGEVPEGDWKYHDWQVAQTTGWWGKPLDPNKFWKGRVMWNDEKATSDAQRHGRLYPPMPYEDTNLPPYPNDDGIRCAGSLDGPNIDYAESSKEGAFWDRFDKTHPRPPDQIKHEQNGNIDQLRHRDDWHIRHNLLNYNYPPEAFTTNALFWAYVQMKRAEYQQFVESTNDPAYRTVMGNLLVDPKLVNEPLPPEQIRAANAWKIAYLQRLRREKTDEQYIQAYLRAWDLNAAEVFGQR